MNLNERLVACIAGYQFIIEGTEKPSKCIGTDNAELLIEWLKQCQFDIVDKKWI